MVAAFGSGGDCLSASRIIEHRQRVDVWSLGRLPDSGLLSVRMEPVGGQPGPDAPRDSFGSFTIPITWDRPMLRCRRPWFQCQCTRRCRFLYLPEFRCARCLRLDWASRHSSVRDALTGLVSLNRDLERRARSERWKRKLLKSG